VSDEQAGYPGAPPGWYADPAGGPGQRWWDGYAWNEAVITPATPPAPPSGLPHAPPHVPPNAPWIAAQARLVSAATSQLVANELGMVQIASVAVAIPSIHYAVDFFVQQAQAAQFHAIGDNFRVMWHAAQNNQPVPSFNETTSLSWLTGLFVLFALVSVVLACVWQHRAASAARALGLPARHSPGWGVGSWFVPVVNLFMPYQAIRDCLPAGHPTRKIVLAWWLILMGAWTTALSAQIAIYFSRPVALAFGIPSLLFAAGLLATAPRMVASIAAEHRAMVEGVARPNPVTV